MSVDIDDKMRMMRTMRTMDHGDGGEIGIHTSSHINWRP
jgi:hypothetical protein